MSSITVQSHQMLERVLSIEIVRVTERAAVSAARLRGRGAEKAADTARDNLSRRWDYVLVPVTLRSLLTAENNGSAVIFKTCHTLDTGRVDGAFMIQKCARRVCLLRVGERHQIAVVHYSSQ